jgi:bilirubin oxidase
MRQRSLKILIAHLILVAGCSSVPSSPSALDAPLNETVIAASGSGSDGSGGNDIDDDDDDDDDGGGSGGGSGSGSGGGGGDGGTAVPAANAILGQPLKKAPAYADINRDPNIYEFNMDVSEADVQILNGAKTRMFVFNGQFPGPTIRTVAGQRVVANVTNNTDKPINVHFHGMVIEPEHDGGPWNTLSPGQSHTYRWVAKKEYPMSGWYHAHPHGMTHVMTPRGMMGTLEVLPPAGTDPLPAAFGDDWLVMSDQKFDFNNQIPPDTEFDRFNGREGDHTFINGQEQPVFKMRPGEIHRFRVLSAGPARHYRIAAPGMTMYQVGTDGGLIERPVLQQDIVMSVAERVELLVQAPLTPGTYKFKTLPYDRGLGLREKFSRDLMTFQVEGAPMVGQPAIPQQLRTIAPLNLAGARTRHFELGAESIGNGRKHFLINEKQFDPLRIDNVARIGDTEIWTIDNKSGNWDHPMHLHSVQFQPLDVDGVPVPFRQWKDTMLAPRSSRIRFAVKFAEDEFPGIFMFHCHILQHEDDGMMTHIMVNPLPSPAPSSR